MRFLNQFVDGARVLALVIIVVVVSFVIGCNGGLIPTGPADYGPATHFVIEAPTEVDAGEPFIMLVIVKDQNDVTVLNYNVISLSIKISIDGGVAWQWITFYNGLIWDGGSTEIPVDISGLISDAQYHLRISEPISGIFGEIVIHTLP